MRGREENDCCAEKVEAQPNLEDATSMNVMRSLRFHFVPFPFLPIAHSVNQFECILVVTTEMHDIRPLHIRLAQHTKPIHHFKNLVFPRFPFISLIFN